MGCDVVLRKAVQQVRGRELDGPDVLVDVPVELRPDCGDLLVQGLDPAPGRLVLVDARPAEVPDDLEQGMAGLRVRPLRVQRLEHLVQGAVQGEIRQEAHRGLVRLVPRLPHGRFGVRVERELSLLRDLRDRAHDLVVRDEGVRQGALALRAEDPVQEELAPGQARLRDAIHLRGGLRERELRRRDLRSPRAPALP